MPLAALDATMLAEDLKESRSRSARIAGAFHGERLLGPKLTIVNPPLWEIGHLGWFQERWCLRYEKGSLKDSILPDADRLYDSSAVAHDTRWGLVLPSVEKTRTYLADVLERVLQRIEREPENESLRYFVRLATFHEDMHAEAFHYTCQTLGYPDPAPERFQGSSEPKEIEVEGGKFALGAVPGKEPFVFDNEKWTHQVELRPFAIAAHPVTNAQYLEYIGAGGGAPRYWKQVDGIWLERRFDKWVAPPGDQPVRHVDWNEAQGFCAWAKRRLPSEAEFELALKTNAIATGAVWEWTSTAFNPYPGFVADPYEDYSQPWFGTHKVLRGASFSTPRRLVRSTFRNFYTAERGDVFCGFRTCSL
jgi:iron(II)-dependent oxidoreductase